MCTVPASDSARTPIHALTPTVPHVSMLVRGMPRPPYKKFVVLIGFCASQPRVSSRSAQRVSAGVPQEAMVFVGLTLVPPMLNDASPVAENLEL